MESGKRKAAGPQPPTTLEEHCAKSETEEVRIYFGMSKQLYADAVAGCSEIFDITEAATGCFRAIRPSILLEDSRILKILRYITVPSLSQMKLGQLVGINSTSVFEDYKAESNSLLKRLASISGKVIEIINDNLDRQRFLWLNTSLNGEKMELARMYAKRWTCSLIGDQNSATAFRNWRKDLQEKRIAAAISSAGYTEAGRRRMIVKVTDLLPGQYYRECRIKGASVQKADFAIRLKESKKLLALEAKAVGVRIDAFKRIKECRDKAEDWKRHFGGEMLFGAVIAGFVPGSELVSLTSGGHLVFWEHSLEELAKYISR